MRGRVEEFFDFCCIAQEHVRNYTIPQYGDYPADEVEEWTGDQCVKAIQKYTKRYEAAQRGRLETLRDMAKIAHFACLAFWKMAPTKEEQDKIMGGEV